MSSFIQLPFGLIENETVKLPLSKNYATAE